MLCRCVHSSIPYIASHHRCSGSTPACFRATGNIPVPTHPANERSRADDLHSWTQAPPKQRSITPLSCCELRVSYITLLCFTVIVVFCIRMPQNITIQIQCCTQNCQLPYSVRFAINLPLYLRAMKMPLEVKRLNTELNNNVKQRDPQGRRQPAKSG